MQEKLTLLAETARLYYEEDLTQSEVGKKLHMSRSKVSRLLKKAKEEEIVEININYPWKRSIKLEQELKSKYNFELVPGEPPLYCDEKLTKNTENILKNILQEKDLVKIDEPSLGSDDCAFFSERIPVVYIRYGSFDEKKGYTNDLHTPSFDFDEDLLAKTSGRLSYLAINLLKKLQ